jgi:hypothetical protein
VHRGRARGPFGDTVGHDAPALLGALTFVNSHGVVLRHVHPEDASRQGNEAVQCLHVRLQPVVQGGVALVPDVLAFRNETQQAQGGEGV